MTINAQTRPAPDRPADFDSAAMIALFAFVILAWSANWVVMKVVVREVSPLWAVAIRTVMAFAVLAPVLLARGQFKPPPRSDYPVIAVIALCHMVAFAALMTAGLKYVSAGRTVVLGYTTPLWVAPAAAIFLKEPLSWRRLLGVVVGLAGLFCLFQPSAFDWRDTDAVFGNALVLLAAMFWSVSILYTRAHRWTATPLDLMPWQTLLAGSVLVALAVTVEGRPDFDLSGQAWLGLAFNGIIGTALGFWAMTVVNRALPATTVSLGVLGTPIVGLGLSMLFLGEPLDATLIVAALLVLAGIVIGARARP